MEYGGVVDPAHSSAQPWLDTDEIRRAARCDISDRELTVFPLEILGLSGIEALDLSGNHLSVLPPEIAHLTSLRELRLGRNQLTHVPPEIGQLPCLEVLDLSDNQLVTVPMEIAGLASLQELDLSGNHLTIVPQEISRLVGLRKLRINRNRVTALPPDISCLARLQELSLDSNRLGAVPPEILRLTNLEILDLGGNQLIVLPPEITGLASLHDLGLRSNFLSAIPPEIAQLSGLQKLDMTGNSLTIIPPEISRLTALRELRFARNQLTRIPPEAGRLASMELLDVSGNKLGSVPPEICRMAALKELWLSGNQLTALPAEIGHLKSLRKLRLGRNRLASLPPEIGSLSGLEILDVSGNALTAVPTQISHLSALRDLWLGDNQLTAIPTELRGLEALRSLDLGVNRLAAVPPEVCLLANLQILWLDGNQLTALPPEISKLTKLRKLWLGGQTDTAITSGPDNIDGTPDRVAEVTSRGASWNARDELNGNQIAVIPQELSRLSSLETLGLGSNQLMCLPAEVCRLAKLKVLDLSSNQLTSLPQEVGLLASMKTLNLRRNQLVTLPAEIGRLTLLEDLDASNYHLKSVPPEIGRLAALRELYLSGNQLTAVPEEIGKLGRLGRLYLDDNQLSDVPASIWQLSRLWWLNLSGNRLSTVPAAISSLTELRVLYLMDNQLNSVPDAIGQLRGLRALYLDDNQLADVPTAVALLTGLTSLGLRANRLTALPWQFAQLLEAGADLALSGNPFHGPVLELLEHGPLILAGYLRSLEQATPQYEAKVLLVGEGNVGKTSLISALRGAPFVEGRPTTHGIEIRTFDLPHPQQNVDLTVRAWDFGGQEVYRVSHQFFFTENALYIVVWKPREGQEQNEVDGWLRRIRLRISTRARALIVATHCAGGRYPDLDYPSLKQAFPALVAGQFEVDNETGQGLPELRQAIAAEVAALPQMGQYLSPQWIAARDAVLSLAESEPQISRDRFTAICQAHQVGSEESAALLVLLHILGRIVYYGDDEGLRDFVVLNPEWLTKAISYVLEDAPTRQSGGILDHARLGEIWQRPPEGPGYPERYHPYFLRLMEKFDISYRLEDDPYRSLVAQLTPHNRPLLPWDFQGNPQSAGRRLTLACRLSEPVPGLIAWLTVRHHRAATGLHWRGGVFLRHPIAAYASEALIELTAPDMLSLQVQAPSPDYFFNVLRDSIEDLMTRRWPGLGYELLVPCPGSGKGGTACPAVIPMEDLRVYREEGETRYLCPRCRTRHDISALLTGFPAQKPELDGIYAGITQIRDEIHGLNTDAAQTADLIRKVLVAVTTEITDCPRLFTLSSREPTATERLRPAQRRYRLVLWCEHPGHWHPWPAATYEIAQPTDWLLRVAPAATVIFKILQLAAPIASAVAGLALTAVHMQNVQNEIQLATALIDSLPSSAPSTAAGLDTVSPGNQLSPAQGEAWRAVRALLFEYDPARTFGDLRRVQAPSGEFLWVCQDHYPEYDPGLPRIPGIN